MKLPFDLGVKLFFRLLLPGFILTVALLPVLLAALDAVGLAGQHETGFVLALIVAGWLVVAADMPIYMLLEGRRGWPAKLSQWMRASEQARLTGLNAAVDAFYATHEPDDEVRRRYGEASVDLRSFPLGSDGLEYVKWPTRLGNTLAAFETYGKTRYGLEAVFYWPRIWVNLDTDLREEIDGQQAMADSAVYATFALGFGAFLWVVYALLPAANGAVTWLLDQAGVRQRLPAGVFYYLPSAPACVALAAGFLAVAAGVYRLAVFTNEQFGVLFTAIIDSHAAKVATYVDVEGIVRKVSDAARIHPEDDEKLEVARRYLQYYLVKLPGNPRAVPFPRVVNPNPPE